MIAPVRGITLSTIREDRKRRAETDPLTLGGLACAALLAARKRRRYAKRVHPVKRGLIGKEPDAYASGSLCPGDSPLPGQRPNAGYFARLPLKSTGSA